jgi:hypothetical protein
MELVSVPPMVAEEESQEQAKLRRKKSYRSEAVWCILTGACDTKLEILGYWDP